MGIFNKKRAGETEKNQTSGVPPLPELPPISDYSQVPELPTIYDEKEYMPTQKSPLPKYPNNSFGNKFSQNAIKDAVIGLPGEKEGGDFGRNESFPYPEETGSDWTMPKSLTKQFTKEIDSMPIPKTMKPMVMPVAQEMEIPEAFSKVKKNEPVFIRLDKFEESMHLLNKAKSEINSIERTLNDIRKVKEEEEKELEYWESQINTIKSQIEKVDREIFSRIE